MPARLPPASSHRASPPSTSASLQAPLLRSSHEQDPAHVRMRRFALRPRNKTIAGGLPSCRSQHSCARKLLGWVGVQMSGTKGHVGRMAGGNAITAEFAFAQQ
eukprot:1217746-Alexandrium_andersonii.AAC.3